MAAAIAVGIAAELTTHDFAFPDATGGASLAVLILVMGLVQGRGLLFPVGLVALTLVAILELLYGTLTVVQAPLVGSALLAAAEFGYWSIELETPTRASQLALLRRVGSILVLVVLGAGLSATLSILATL